MALYNGNISETYWKSSSDNVLRKYGYSYDGLNRLNASLYMKPMTSQQRGMDLGSYNEHITYDKNGNINTLFRNGDLDSNLDVIEIDDLDYIYDSGNKLLKVIDNSNHPEGFKDGVNSGNDYSYDDHGNMIQDLNKGINSITYNHLNLPKKITYSSSSQNISYLYNALGVKVQKKVFRSGIVGTFNPDHTVTTDYLSGFHYEFNDNPNLPSSGGLVFFATAEGYVNVITRRSVSYNYVYNYTDHLGNVRVSYTSGTGGVASILEENHYYPFGLKHKKYGSTVKNFVEIEDGDGYFVGIEIVPPGARKTYQYKYNGKEFQDELGLNWTSMDYRNYDNALGRFSSMDILAELAPGITPYRFAFNNPVYWSDSTGLFEENSNYLAICPTCPNTPEFQPFIDDPNILYSYDPETETLTQHTSVEIEEVKITNRSTSSRFGWAGIYTFFSPMEMAMIGNGVGSYSGILSNLAKTQSVNHITNYGSALESALDITEKNKAYYAKLAKGAGRVATGLSIATTAYSINSVFNQYDSGGWNEVFSNRDVFDATVGVAGLTATAGLALGFGAANIWNPIGWVAIAYGVGTLIYDLSNE